MKKKKSRPPIDSHYVIYIDTCDNLPLDKAKDLVQSMVNKLASDSRVFTIVSGCGSLKFLYKKQYAKDIVIELENSGASNTFDAINKIVRFIEEDKLKTDRVFILISNSSDNSSDFTFNQTISLIQDRQKNGWDFWLSGNDFAKTDLPYFSLKL